MQRPLIMDEAQLKTKIFISDDFGEVVQRSRGEYRVWEYGCVRVWGEGVWVS